MRCDVTHQQQQKPKPKLMNCMHDNACILILNMCVCITFVHVLYGRGHSVRFGLLSVRFCCWPDAGLPALLMAPLFACLLRLLNLLAYDIIEIIRVCINFDQIISVRDVQETLHWLQNSPPHWTAGEKKGFTTTRWADLYMMFRHQNPEYDLVKDSYDNMNIKNISLTCIRVARNSLQNLWSHIVVIWADCSKQIGHVGSDRAVLFSFCFAVWSVRPHWGLGVAVLILFFASFNYFSACLTFS